MVLRLKALRKAANLGQVEAASLMGVSQPVLANWENETALPRTRQLPDIARVYGCTIDDLFDNRYLAEH